MKAIVFIEQHYSNGDYEAVLSARFVQLGEEQGIIHISLL